MYLYYIAEKKRKEKNDKILSVDNTNVNNTNSMSKEHNVDNVVADRKYNNIIEYYVKLRFII